jgi:glutamyl-tRNA reductase
MVLMVLGLSHQTAPIQIREKLAFTPYALSNALHDIVEKGLADEVIIISTCNRTEIYYTQSLADNQPLLNWLKCYKKIALAQFESLTYYYTGVDAVNHLMKVASGLNSMVLGEAEILGQVKTAYTIASNTGTVGKYLGRLFQTAFGVAKNVRTHTGINENPLSIAYVAARLSRHIFSDLTKVAILLVGAGELIHMTMKHLKRLGVEKIWIANRTLKNAESFAQQFQGEVISLNHIKEKLKEVDIVMTATASEVPLINKEMVAKALKLRKHKPIFMVDLAVPRNIEPKVSELEDVYLYCLDDLKNIAKENRRLREEASLAAEPMIYEEAESFMQGLAAEEAIKMVKLFRQRYEKLSEDLLKNALHRLTLGDSPEEVLKRFAKNLTNRFMHGPSCRLRRFDLRKDKILLKFTEEIFGLNYERIDIS